MVKEEKKFDEIPLLLLKPEKPLRLQQQKSQEKNGLKVEVPIRIDIENDYILTSHLGDWENLYTEYTFSLNQQSWNL